MNGIRGKITVNGQPIDEYAKEQQEKDFTKYINRQIFEIHNEIEETQEDFIYKVFDEHLRETGRGSFSKADLYRAVYLLEEERAGRLVYSGNRWIPVTERLPEYGQKVLMWKKFGWKFSEAERVRFNIPEGVEDEHFDYFIDEWGKNGHYIDVVAWMPLPTPYEGSDSDAVD